MKNPAAPADDRVSWLIKISYGTGTAFEMWGHWLYPTIAFQIFGLYLHVPEWQIGIAVIFNRVFDACSDPFFGWLSDNTRSRFGRRRPYMLFGGILAGIGLPLLLAIAPGWQTTHFFGAEFSNYFWFMLISSAIYLPIVSCFSMPYHSLGNELTPDYHERTSIYAFKNAVQKVMEFGLYFFGLFFSMNVWVGADSNNVLNCIRRLVTDPTAWRIAPEGTTPNTLLGAQVYLVICGLLMVFAALACTIFVRERYYNTLIAGRQPRIPIVATLRQTLTCRPFLIMQLMNMIAATSQSMVGTLGLTLTIFHVCQGNKPEGNWWNFWMGMSGFALGLLGIMLFTTIARKSSKHVALKYVFISVVAVFLSSWWLYTPRFPWLQLLASGGIALVNAGYCTLIGSMGADVVDYDELNGGNRREGAFAACNSWFMKGGMALGAGFSYFVLGWIGFDSHAAQQSEATLTSVRVLFGAVPACGTLLALVVLKRFPLTQDTMSVIRSKLETRRGSA